MITLDPILVLSARYALAILFFVAAITKLRHFGVFRATLADYEILPSNLLLTPFSGVVIATEFTIAVAILFYHSAVIAMLAGAVVLFVYAVAIGINLIRGRRDIDCGCTGPAVKQLLSGWLLVRNGVLVALALVGAQNMAPRVLSYVDMAFVGLILAAGVVLYLAANQLMANAPKLDALDALMENA